jgi:hypothetical protein
MNNTKKIIMNNCLRFSLLGRQRVRLHGVLQDSTNAVFNASFFVFSTFSTLDHSIYWVLSQ